MEIVLEGGPRLGFGHAGRCLALWEELGADAVFRVDDGAVSSFLQDHGAPVVRAAQAPLVVLDRAVPVASAEVRALAAEGRRAVLIDDLGPARMHAEMVVDLPTAARWPAAVGQRLAGFEHVLLRHEVREAMPAHPVREGVLLAMGGSDPAGLTPGLARELSAIGMEVRVALGPGYRGLSPTEGSVLRSPEQFIAELARAELLVAGYGHSLLEAAHLGVPAIAVVYKAEHLPHARAFCSHGTAQMFDLTAGPGERPLAHTAARLLEDSAARADMSACGRQLVDGLGARRVAAAIMGLA